VDWFAKIAAVLANYSADFDWDFDRDSNCAQREEIWVSNARSHAKKRRHGSPKGILKRAVA
jgi:hypothetical protein